MVHGHLNIDARFARQSGRQGRSEMTVVKIDDHLLVQSMIDYGSYGQQKMDGHENIERARSIFEKLPLDVVSPAITEETGQKILEKLDDLNIKLELIFGNHAFVKGRFIDLSFLEVKK